MRLFKSVLYRVYASSITFLIALVFTGKASTSIAIGVVEFVGKVFSYWVFDAAWDMFFMRKHKNQHRCILISGVQGAGKTEIGKSLVRRIGHKDCILLDGDAMRNSISYGLGFSNQDITENLRRVSSLANILIDQGHSVVIACVAASRSDRKMIREILSPHSFIEVHVDCSDTELKKRRVCSGRNTMSYLVDNYELTTDYQTIRIDTTGKTPESSARELAKKLL